MVNLLCSIACIDRGKKSLTEEFPVYEKRTNFLSKYTTFFVYVFLFRIRYWNNLNYTRLYTNCYYESVRMSKRLQEIGDMLFEFHVQQIFHVREKLLALTIIGSRR